MKTIEAVRRTAVTIEADQTIQRAAELMESANVGALAVVDHGALVGVVTDRDLVRRGIAGRVPLEARIDALMSSPVVTIDADADLHDAFALLRANSVRRLAVTRGDELAGMLSVDDLLMDLSADLADLARPVTGEVLFGHHDSSVPASR